MDKHIELIEQLIDQAIKAGVIGNLQTAAAVAASWEQIKKAALNGSANSNNNS